MANGSMWIVEAKFSHGWERSSDCPDEYESRRKAQKAIKLRANTWKWSKKLEYRVVQYRRIG